MSSYPKKTTRIVRLPSLNLNTPEQCPSRGAPQSSEDTEKWLENFTKETGSSDKEFLVIGFQH